MADRFAQRPVLESLTQESAAWLVSLSSRRLRDSDAPRNTDGTYPGRELVVWAVARSITDADPLMSGSSSPWLEKYREQAARKAKRENDKAEGLLIDSSSLSAQLSEIGRVFREEAAAIERLHGVAIGDLIRSAVDRAESSWRAALNVVEVAKELDPVIEEAHDDQI